MVHSGVVAAQQARISEVPLVGVGDDSGVAFDGGYLPQPLYEERSGSYFEEYGGRLGG